MKIGAIFPHTEISPTSKALCEYAIGIENAGLNQIVLYDHILGAGLTSRPNFRGPFNNSHPFHEVFTTLAFMAAVTNRVVLSTGVLVLPQRQTALAAKQSAQVDLLSEGRLRLGVGVGWNQIEYEGQGVEFKSRGRRFEEQVSIMKMLWTKSEIDVSSEFHSILDSGINPRPRQQPIPIWFGTRSAHLLDRVARLADGWIPFSNSASEVSKDWIDLQGLLKHYKRGDNFGLEGHLILREYPKSEWQNQINAWQLIGATDLCIATTGLGLGSDAAAHVELLEEVFDNNQTHN